MHFFDMFLHYFQVYIDKYVTHRTGNFYHAENYVKCKAVILTPQIAKNHKNLMVKSEKEIVQNEREQKKYYTCIIFL